MENKKYYAGRDNDDDDDGVSHRSRGDSKLPTTRLKRDGKLINKREAREAGSARPEAITENRGDNQGDEKKGKTHTRRTSMGKKEGRKACVLWCPRKKNKF